MTSFDMRRKRPRWVGWIPAAALVAIIAGVGVTTTALLGNGLGRPAPAPTVGEVTELNWSSFSTEGLGYIERSRDVRIDLSRRPVDATALGLPADGTTTIGPSANLDTDNDYYLIINGGGEGYGGKKFTASEVSITSVGGDITTIGSRASAAVPFRLALKTLGGQSEEFGWRPLDDDAIFAAVNRATTAGEPYQFTAGPGDRLGITVSAIASCEPMGACVLQYIVTPGVR